MNGVISPFRVAFRPANGNGRNVMRVCRPAGHSWKANPSNGFPSNARFAPCLPSAEHSAMTEAQSHNHGVLKGNAICSNDGNAPQTSAILLFTPPSSKTDECAPQILILLILTYPTLPLKMDGPEKRWRFRVCRSEGRSRTRARSGPGCKAIVRRSVVRFIDIVSRTDIR